MKRPDFIARQASNPTGIIGGLIARIMAKETAPENQTALKFLELQKGDRFLDVGTGHGTTIHAATRRIKQGLVAGIDISNTMLGVARRQNRKHIKSGLVELRRASSDNIPYADQSFTKLLSVHTIYFLQKLDNHLAEIFRVTKPGGRFVLCFRPSDDPLTVNFPTSVYTFRSKADVLTALETAGFHVVSAQDVESEGRIFVFSIAERPAG